ncbi:soluble NSF attachment protein [Trichoderma velutinum]
MDNPEALIQQADKLVAKGGSGWSLFGGSDEKFWDAARLYKEAAQAYQLKGDTADIREKKLKEPTDAADSYVNASDAYRKARAEVSDEAIRREPEARNKASEAVDAALRCRTKAIELIQTSSSENKANRVSRIKEVVGQIYERDMLEPDLEKARMAYKEAADWIRVERELNSNKLLAQYADLTTFIATTKPHNSESGPGSKYAYYEDAIKAYEAIIKTMQGNGNMRWSLPPYYFKVCVCRLAQCDPVGTRREIEKYQQIDNEVSSQYKYRLLFDLLEAMDEHDQTKFATCLKEFDRTSKLDEWQTNVFLDAKNSIEPPDDEFA